MVYKYGLNGGRVPIRYVRVTGDPKRIDFLNLSGLELWNGSTRLRAVDGSVKPMAVAPQNPNCCGWKNLDDGDLNTIAHTEYIADRSVELDFGATGQLADTVKVLNRADKCAPAVCGVRLAGSVLTVVDIKGNTVLTKTLGTDAVYSFPLS